MAHVVEFDRRVLDECPDVELLSCPSRTGCRRVSTLQCYDPWKYLPPRTKKKSCFRRVWIMCGSRIFRWNIFCWSYCSIYYLELVFLYRNYPYSNYCCYILSYHTVRYAGKTHCTSQGQDGLARSSPHRLRTHSIYICHYRLLIRSPEMENSIYLRPLHHRLFAALISSLR